MTATGWSAAPDYAAIYAQHAPEIHDFLVRTVRDHAAAEDLTQTTFTRLLEKGGTVREAEKVRPWLFTVAHNLAVNHVTRRRPSDPIEAAFAIASGDKGPEEEALATAAAALVWDAARSLEPRQYAILDLSVRHGFTVAEIAEVLEINAGHAAVLVHRAREALAQAIRLLVVVRQRRHCVRLAEIVPPGTDLLTPDLRASVDRHMRRCEACKDVGARLTDPVELFSTLPLLPLPIALHLPIVLHQFGHPMTGPHPTAPAAPATPAPSPGVARTGLRHAAQRARELTSNPAAMAAAAGIVALGITAGTVLPRLGHNGSAPTARHSGTSSISQAFGDNVVVPQPVPPLTGDTTPARRIVQDGGDATVHPVTQLDGDVVEGTPTPPTPAPTPPPPAPTPAPLLDLTLTGQPVSPAGAHVVVGPPPPAQPTVSVTLIGPDGQPIPLPVSTQAGPLHPA